MDSIFRVSGVNGAGEGFFEFFWYHYSSMADHIDHRGRVRLMWAIAAGWIGLELAAYAVHGPASWLAARVWAFIGVGVLFVGLIEIGFAVGRSLRRTPFAAVLALSLLGATAFWGISGVERVTLDNEATQQVASGLDSFSEPDWKYTGSGFLGYPSRQYLIVSLPALILGRTLLGLRIGYALVFVFGVLIFWAGLFRTWEKLPWGESMVPIATTALLSFPYLLEHVRHFEQSILPVSFTLAAVGWLLLARHRPTFQNFVALAWVGAMLGTCYTPGLASWVLLYVALLWLASQAVAAGRRDLAASWVAVTVVVVVFAVISFSSRTDLLHGDGGALVGSPGLKSLKGLEVFFFGHPRAFLSPVLYLPVVLFLGLALCGRLRLPSFVVASWSIGVVAVAGALQGYAAPPPEFSLHRAIVVVPPLVVACAWWALVRLRLRRGMLQVFFLVLCALVAHDLWFLTGQHMPSVRDTVYGDMIGQAREADINSDTEVLMVLLDRSGIFDNATDYTDYFFPRARVVRSKSEAFDIKPSQKPLIAYTNTPQWNQSHQSGNLDEAQLFRFRRRNRTVSLHRVVARHNR